MFFKKKKVDKPTSDYEKIVKQATENLERSKQINNVLVNQASWFVANTNTMLVH